MKAKKTQAERTNPIAENKITPREAFEVAVALDQNIALQLVDEVERLTAENAILRAELDSINALAWAVLDGSDETEKRNALNTIHWKAAALTEGPAQIPADDPDRDVLERIAEADDNNLFSTLSQAIMALGRRLGEIEKVLAPPDTDKGSAGGPVATYLDLIWSRVRKLEANLPFVTDGLIERIYRLEVATGNAPDFGQSLDEVAELIDEPGPLPSSTTITLRYMDEGATWVGGGGGVGSPGYATGGGGGGGTKIPPAELDVALDAAMEERRNEGAV